MNKHPCHKEQLTSIRRIEGQIRGIQKMIDEGQYCIDILNQIKAVKNSITTVEGKILKKHLNECIKESLTGKNSYDEKVDEIVKLLKR
jgi:DNA-binding FrmR family transcriptional regulator